jgi:hypothetical protein
MAMNKIRINLSTFYAWAGGDIMRKQALLGLTVMLALLLALSAGAWAEVYVEGFLGGTTATNLGRAKFHQQDLPEPPPPPPPPPQRQPNTVANGIGSFLYLKNTGGVAPSLIGGARVGTWFVPEGFLGFNYPKWMKYFGFYTDISYQRLDVPEQSTWVDDFNDSRVYQGTFPGKFYSRGYVVTWAFMFAARCGFLPNEEVPFGRLQPWVAVGPGILFTGMRPKATVYAGNNVGAIANPGWDSAVTPALVVDAGVRYMIRQNISVDLSFRYRYAKPHFNFEFTDIRGVPSNLRFAPTYNLFSGMAGIAYHF